MWSRWTSEAINVGNVIKYKCAVRQFFAHFSTTESRKTNYWEIATDSKSPASRCVRVLGARALKNIGSERTLLNSSRQTRGMPREKERWSAHSAQLKSERWTMRIWISLVVFITRSVFIVYFFGWWSTPKYTFNYAISCLTIITAAWCTNCSLISVFIRWTFFYFGHTANRTPNRAAKSNWCLKCFA